MRLGLSDNVQLGNGRAVQNTAEPSDGIPSTPIPPVPQGSGATQTTRHVHLSGEHCVIIIFAAIAIAAIIYHRSK